MRSLDEISKEMDELVKKHKNIIEEDKTHLHSLYI